MSSEDEENLDRDRDTQGEHSRTTGAETSAATGPGTFPSHQKLEETRKDPRPEPRRECGFWVSDLQHCEKINLCCLEPPVCSVTDEGNGGKRKVARIKSPYSHRSLRHTACALAPEARVLSLCFSKTTFSHQKCLKNSFLAIHSRTPNFHAS